jgi:hypothetical protein
MQFTPPSISCISCSLAKCDATLFSARTLCPWPVQVNNRSRLYSDHNIWETICSIRFQLGLYVTAVCPGSRSQKAPPSRGFEYLPLHQSAPLTLMAPLSLLCSFHREPRLGSQGPKESCCFSRKGYLRCIQLLTSMSEAYRPKKLLRLILQKIRKVPQRERPKVRIPCVAL